MARDHKFWPRLGCVLLGLSALRCANYLPTQDTTQESGNGATVATGGTAEDTNFDIGPLAPVAYASPTPRTGFLSPVTALATCMVSTSNKTLGASLCASGSAASFSVAYERLVVAGACVTTTRPALNLFELPVTLTPCSADNPNQRWGYKGGNFYWGQNPNRCLDANLALGGNGLLVARMCDPNSASQVFAMHSAQGDAQVALAMGPNTLFMPLGNGFLGSDAGATASLEHNRTLFMFNDTYMNQQGGNSRANINGFVHNSMGVMQCDDIVQTANCFIKYYFGGQLPTATSLLNDPNASYYFWPGTGAIFDGSLLMLNGRTVSSSGGLGFSNVGLMIARITNPQDTPDLWDITQMDVSHNPNVSAVSHIAPNGVPHGSWAAQPDDANYAYFFLGTNSGRPLMRLPFAELASASAYLLEQKSAWQYLTSQKTWTNWPQGGADPTDIGSVQPAPNLGNINYDEVAKLYYYVGQSTNLYLQPGVFFTSSPSVTGPWSPLTSIWSPPETNSSSPLYISKATCYASFAHPELAKAGQLAFTYQCASSDYSQPMSFRQKLIKMQMPGAAIE